MRKETDKLRYQYLKNRKRCTWCKKQDERTLAGKTLCTECAAKHNAFNNRTPAEKKKEWRENYKRTRAERKAKGLCPYCGEPATDGYVTCERHRSR